MVSYEVDILPPVVKAERDIVTTGGNWGAGYDITNSTCLDIGVQVNVRIDSKPSDRGAGVYCLYMSQGANCLCQTETLQIDLTKSKWHRFVYIVQYSKSLRPSQMAIS